MVRVFLMALMLTSGASYAQCRADGKYDGILFTMDDNVPGSLLFTYKGKHSFVQKNETGSLVFYFTKPESVEVRDIGFVENSHIIDARYMTAVTVKGKCFRVVRLIKVYGLEVSSDKKLVFQVDKGKPNAMVIKTDTTIDVPISEKRTFTTVFRKDFVYSYEVNMRVLFSKGRKEEQDVSKIRQYVNFRKLTDAEGGLMEKLFGDDDLGVKRITYQIIDK